jgi:hypothetical protein
VRARNDGVGPVTITGVGITVPFARTTPPCRCRSFLVRPSISA